MTNERAVAMHRTILNLRKSEENALPNLTESEGYSFPPF